MKSFKIIYENVLRSLIQEGGNAVPNVDRIKRENIFKTVDAFKKEILSEFFGYVPTEKEMFLLGSTGKKADSGDIDIGIDLNILKERNKILNLIKLNEICSRNGYNSCVNSINLSMVHIVYPQVGEIGKNVQIDVLITECPAFAKFFMYSPMEGESKYKSAHRNTLFRAILYCISYKPIEFDENKQPVRWNQFDINDSGIYMQLKTLIDENGYRLLYKNTNEPLETSYAKVERESLTTNDVDEAIRIMFGDGFQENELDTFEHVFEIISSDRRFKHKNLKDEIFRKAASELKEAENRLDFPEELNNYL